MLFAFFRGHVAPIPFTPAGFRLERELVVQALERDRAGIAVLFRCEPVDPSYITGRYFREKHFRSVYLVAGSLLFPSVVGCVHSVSERLSVIRIKCSPIHRATGDATPLPHILYRLVSETGPLVEMAV